MDLNSIGMAIFLTLLVSSLLILTIIDFYDSFKSFKYYLFDRMKYLKKNIVIRYKLQRVTRFYSKYKIRVPVAVEDYNHFLFFKQNYLLKKVKINQALKYIPGIEDDHKINMKDAVQKIIRLQYELYLLQIHDEISASFLNSSYAKTNHIDKFKNNKNPLTIKEYYDLSLTNIHTRKLLLLLRKGYTVDQVVEYGNLPHEWLTNAL